jgi:uncharacterized protein
VPLQSPIPDEVDALFWEACNEYRLVVQFCTACRLYRFPPATTCWECDAATLQWREVGGTGTIYSYTVVHDTPVATLKADVPYNVAVVEIEGANGVNMVAHLRGVPVDEVPIGAAVEVEFEPTPATGQKVPVWRIAAGAARHIGKA